MILSIGDRKFVAHFHHTKNLNPSEMEPWAHKTFCIVHEGLCPIKKCPQDLRSEHTIGQARCAKTDMFNKQTGRILAFTRAVQTYPRGIRGLMLLEYFQHIPYRRK